MSLRWLYRLYVSWCLKSEETYLHILQREGWSEYNVRPIRLKCQALRVELMLCQ